ncbi:MAG: family 43 glycosylhydrolase [Eubacteriales bacterium]|nr:family 43 glycosylhydrolase [Eubacteriales bacterium]
MKRCINKKLAAPAVGILIAGLALFAQKTDRAGGGQNGFTLPQYHNADAKFLGERIITSVDEEIRILDLNGQETGRLDGLRASWIYVMEDDGGNTPGMQAEDEQDVWTVAYSNHSNETHILRLDAGGGLLDDRIAVTSGTLAIDPILVEADGRYYLTNTEIEGTINNPDPEGDNGVYTVKLYRSDDLESWEYVTDIISRKQNLEDGDIRYEDGVFYYFFEMEDYDKGPSRICVMTSEDPEGGWSGPLELLPDEADNEMASCERTADGWRLYVSSDRDCVGESYQGASVYYCDYTADFQPVALYQRSDMPDNESVRLYEVKERGGELSFLFARNFLTDCDFLMRTLPSEADSPE